MRNLVSGAYTGTPNPHLIYVKYVYGYLLTLFYNQCSSIDWYGLSFLFMHALSLYLILKNSLDFFKKNKIFYIILLVFIFIFLDFKNIIQFQFTTTSAVCAATAIYLYFINDNSKVLNVKYFEIMFLVTICYCIRSQVLLMSVPFAFLVFLYKNYDKIISKNFRDIFIYIIPILCIVFSISFIEKQQYSSNIWKEYKEYNVARSDLLDYYGFPDYYQNEQFFIEQNVSVDAYSTLLAGNLVLAEEITSDNLISIANLAKENYKNTMSRKHKAISSIKETIKTIFNISNFYILSIFFLILFIFFNAYKSKKYAICFCVFSLFCLKGIIYFYFFYTSRFPERVMDSLILIEFSICFGLIYYLGVNWNNFYSKIKIVLFLCLICLQVLYCNNYMSGNNIETGMLSSLIDYCDKHIENQYILKSTIFSTDVFKVHRSSKFINYLNIMGWSINSNEFLNKKKDFELDIISNDLIEKNNLFLINSSINDINNQTLDYIYNYYKSKNIDILFETIDTVVYQNNSINIVKILKR